jgi:hypothetical protein
MSYGNKWLSFLPVGQNIGQFLIVPTMGESELIDYQMIIFITFISRWGNQPQFSNESCGIFLFPLPFGKQIRGYKKSRLVLTDKPTALHL